VDSVLETLQVPVLHVYALNIMIYYYTTVYISHEVCDVSLMI
jgi:hypothetical protein